MKEESKAGYVYKHAPYLMDILKHFDSNRKVEIDIERNKNVIKAVTMNKGCSVRPTGEE